MIVIIIKITELNGIRSDIVANVFLCVVVVIIIRHKIVVIVRTRKIEHDELVEKLQ